MNGNLCSILKDDLTFNCDNFMESLPAHGLFSVLSRLTDNLNVMYFIYENNTSPANYFQSITFWEETMTILNLIPLSFNYMKDQLLSSFKEISRTFDSIRTSLFIVFLLFCIATYLGFWSPFVTSLTQNVI